MLVLCWLAYRLFAKFSWFWMVVLGLHCVLVAVLVIRQHSMVKPGDLDRVNQAFFDMNATISVALLVVGVIDCYWVN